jgi:hypothetical protein
VILLALLDRWVRLLADDHRYRRAASQTVLPVPLAVVCQCWAILVCRRRLGADAGRRGWVISDWLLPHYRAPLKRIHGLPIVFPALELGRRSLPSA